MLSCLCIRRQARPPPLPPPTDALCACGDGVGMGMDVVVVVVVGAGLDMSSSLSTSSGQLRASPHAANSFSRSVRVSDCLLNCWTISLRSSSVLGEKGNEVCGVANDMSVGEAVTSSWRVCDTAPKVKLSNIVRVVVVVVVVMGVW